MEERRPTPEEMLERAALEEARAGRGRLKIFFGAAPGVGKTYAMLEAARARKRQGADVVIGLVETHGRRDTEALTEGLELLPSKSIDHRGVTLREFDLDGALVRHPELLLLDELAHTNAPGSRHLRRWQDVIELIEDGVDVYTTLNVQHVESLNDVVAQITGVHVQETVPDSTLDLADEIELVDLPPDDLLERLREGKIYIPAQAERASRNFFRKGNLIALRELALRKTAERVDAQAVEWKREQGIEEPLPTRERILVAVNHRQQSADVVRSGRRMASSLHAPWIALAVETPAFDRLPEEVRDRVSEHLALAEGLGAERLVVRGERVSDEILAVARERNITRIVIGKPTHARWRDWIRGSLIDELVRGSAGVEVVVTSGEKSEREPKRIFGSRRRSRPAEYAWALVPVLSSTLICWVTRPIFNLADQAMVYLLGVLIAASALPRGPSLLAAVASVAALDFCFVPPYFTFAVGDLRYVITFAVMLIVGLSVSRRTVLIREQAEAARQRERRTAALFAMSREFSVEDEANAIARTALTHVRDLTESDAVVLLARDGKELVPLAGEATGLFGTQRELAVARWVFEHGRPAGYGTDTLPASETVFLPLVGASGTIGVFGVALGQRKADPSPSLRQLLETFVAQTALALERVLLREETSRAKLAIETERLRNDLLSTVSHDLRTPLASITGAAGVLLEKSAPLDEEERRELLETVKEESERLNRLVGNLLDLTRIESGNLRIRKEWVPIEEVVHSAIGRLSERLADHRVLTELPEAVLLAPIDPVLIEQVLVNLLENAAKYSPARSTITVRAEAAQDAVVCEVMDEGRGIPHGEEQKIFEKFYRVADGRRAEGAGLGLTVCQAILRAHGGTIQAENRREGGALFRFSLPITGETPLVDTEWEEVRS
jgi:two-component system sensor histidine kinase KdpD